MQYDVIVAGAGPAGSTAARECAARGLSVVLVDKSDFPRDKPCGGGVNVRAAALLPFALQPVVERTIRGLHVSVRQKHGYTRYSSLPLTYLTQRRFLDTFLVEKAVQSGVVFRERCPVRAVERRGRRVTVYAGSEKLEGRSLIAADGANGPTANLAGLQVARWKSIALEANLSPQPFPEQWQDVFAIDVGSTPGGYGWLFPKGEHINVGVGGWHSAGPALRSQLHHLTRAYGFDPSGLWGQRGHPLPVRCGNARLVDANMVVVGDAAGLLDPLSGEGIYAAIWSGRAAAQTLSSYHSGVSSDLEAYGRMIDADLAPELRIATQLHDLFHLRPALWAALLRRSPRMWRVVCGLLTGEVTYVSIKNRWNVLPPLIDLMTDAVRAASIYSCDESSRERPGPDRYLRTLARVSLKK